ncbi:hypothetical protein ACLOJK_020181 [Asimina triloba]
MGTQTAVGRCQELVSGMRLIGGRGNLLQSPKLQAVPFTSRFLYLRPSSRLSLHLLLLQLHRTAFSVDGDGPIDFADNPTFEV